MNLLKITLLSALFSGALMTSANAHTELVSTSPTSGETITAAQSIDLTFSEAPLLAGSSISLLDGEGNTLSTNNATLNDSVLSVDWPTDAYAGLITVNWRAVADDGHVVTGTYSFDYEPDSNTVNDISTTQIPPAVATPLAVGITPERDLALGTSSARKAPASAIAGVVLLLVAAGVVLRILLNKRKDA